MQIRNLTPEQRNDLLLLYGPDPVLDELRRRLMAKLAERFELEACRGGGVRHPVGSSTRDYAPEVSECRPTLRRIIDCS